MTAAVILRGPLEASCAGFLRDLQQIWDDVGASDAERDTRLLFLEQECLKVYEHEVAEASKQRVELRAAVAEGEKDVIAMCEELGEKYEPLEVSNLPLKAQLASVKPRVDRLRALKDSRQADFAEVTAHIARLQKDLSDDPALDETLPPGAPLDLTLGHLEDLREKLRALQQEKAARLDTVLSQVRKVAALCRTLGLDLTSVVGSVHPSLPEDGGVATPTASKNVTMQTLTRLDHKLVELQEEKIRRMNRVVELGAALVEVWNLLDVPPEEQRPFLSLAQYLDLSKTDITEPNALSEAALQSAEAEVARLEVIKASRLKELVGKRRNQLEALCAKAHMTPPENTAQDKTDAIINSGLMDPSELLSTIEEQIKEAQEEAVSRQTLMVLVDKFLQATEEERWLETYEKDDNRYAASRGQHLILRRAEAARAAVKKLPATMEALNKAVKAWEKDHSKTFTYDGKRVVDLVEEHKQRAAHAEEEKRRQREEERAQKAQTMELESLFGSTRSPSKIQKGTLKTPRRTAPITPVSNRRMSMGGVTLHSALHKAAAPSGSVTPHRATPGQKPRPAAPANFVALAHAPPPPPPTSPPRTASPAPTSPTKTTPPVATSPVTPVGGGLYLDWGGSPVKDMSPPARGGCSSQVEEEGGDENEGTLTPHHMGVAPPRPPFSAWVNVEDSVVLHSGTASECSSKVPSPLMSSSPRQSEDNVVFKRRLSVGSVSPQRKTMWN